MNYYYTPTDWRAVYLPIPDDHSCSECRRWAMEARARAKADIDG